MYVFVLALYRLDFKMPQYGCTDLKFLFTYIYNLVFFAQLIFGSTILTILAYSVLVLIIVCINGHKSQSYYVCGTQKQIFTLKAKTKNNLHIFKVVYIETYGQLVPVLLNRTFSAKGALQPFCQVTYSYILNLTLVLVRFFLLWLLPFF